MQGTNVPKQPTIPAMPNKREMGGKGMSKKYIIEIEDAPYMAEEGNTSIALYKAVGFNSLVFDKNGLDKLEPLDDACKNCLDKGDADEAYKCGLEDGWDAAKKIALPTANGGYSYDELNECFGKERETVKGMLKNTPVTEAVKKIREYEERKAQEDAICNGDEVCVTMFGRDFKAIAIQKDGFGDWHVLNERGGFSLFSEADLTKTGRHINLRDLFGGEIE